MTDLELSIYEAERYGEIDEDTRDIMLEMVATEGANWDNMKKYTNIKNQVTKAIMQSRVLLKKNDFSGAKAKMNEVKGYAQTIRQEIASSDSSVVSAVLSYFIPTIGEFAINVVAGRLQDAASSKRTAMSAKITADAISGREPNVNPKALNSINRLASAGRTVSMTASALHITDSIRGAITAIKEVKSSSSGEVNPSTLNRYKQVTVTRMGDIIKGIDMYINHIDKLEAQYRKAQQEAISSIGESTDDLKMDIYESERYGEISIEERDELLSYLD